MKLYIYNICRNRIIIYLLSFQTENGSPGDFLNPFTVCSLCKQKFDVCPFVDEETSGSYLFANRLKGLSRLSPSVGISGTSLVLGAYFHGTGEIPQCWFYKTTALYPPSL
jgi:hypothetical protein